MCLTCYSRLHVSLFFFFDEDRITEGSKGKESSVLFIFWLDDLRTYVVAYQPPVIKTNIIYLYLPRYVGAPPVEPYYVCM